MKILIVYGTTEGQTRKVATYMADVLNAAGHNAVAADAAGNPPALSDYDAALVGGSVHIGKYQTAVEKYVRQNLLKLNQVPSAFFSVCLAITSQVKADHQEAEKITRNYLADLGWTPLVSTQIAGAMKYSNYSFLKRMIMKMIAKREGRSVDMSNDVEYTDWNNVKKFALDFAIAATISLEQTTTDELKVIV